MSIRTTWQQARSVAAILLISSQTSLAADSSTLIHYGLTGVLAVNDVNIVNPTTPVVQSFGNGSGASAEIRAWAQVGRLEAYASGHVPAATTTGTLLRSQWDDTVVIDSLGLTGSSGSAQVSLAYSWNLALTDPSPYQSFAAGDVKLLVQGGFVSYYSEIQDGLNASNCGSTLCPVSRSAVLVGSSGGPVPVPPGAGTLHLEFGFVFGRPFSLTASLTGYAFEFGSPTSSVDSLVDASHTVLWGGIQGVTGSAGAVSYTVSSASGFDYRLATVVPEPTTTSMLVTGLLIFGLVGVWRQVKTAVTSQ